MQRRNARAALTALCTALLAAISVPAWAGAADFEFQPVAADIKTGADSEIAVRLVDKRTGTPVPGAIVFRTRLDMSPDDMGDMTAEHEPLPSTEPGVYRFRAGITMAGRWAFKLQAKVKGESETVEGMVLLQAKE